MAGEQKEDMKQISITLVPVAHISKKSARLVRETIELEKPKLVGLELCRERLEGLVKEQGRHMDLRMMLSHPTSGFLFVAQQLLGRWWNIKPGGEMMAALQAAGDTGTPVALLDKPVRAIARDIERIPLREKIGLVFSGGFDPLPKKATLSELMKPETLKILLAKMKKDFPVSYKVFVDSRNKYMFRKLLLHKAESAVVVVGAAHVLGIMELAKNSEQKINIKVVRG